MFKSHNICIRWSTLYWIEHDWLYLCVIELLDNVRKYFATSIGWKAWIQEERQKVLSWARPPLFENNLSKLPSPRHNMPTVNITPSLCVHIVSILNMIQSCIYTARKNILPRMERSPNLKQGTYRSRHTRNYVFASSLVAGLEPHCHMAKYILYIIIIYYIVLLYIIILYIFLRAACWQVWRGGSHIATLPQGATWLNIAVCPRGGN